MKYFFNMNSNYDYLIIDLDNSLIDENVYLHYAFSEITKQSQDSQYKLDWIWTRFLTIGRNNLISNYCDHFNLDDQLANYLEILRNVKIDLKIFNEVENFICKFNSKILIVTNGNKTQQKNKLRNINLKFKYSVIYASGFEKPKPFINCVSNILKPEDKVLIVGDNIIDYKFSKNLNADFAQVKFTRDLDGFIIHDTIKLHHRDK